MKSPFDRGSFKALRKGVAGRGGLGSLADSALVGWRAARSMKASGRKAGKRKGRSRRYQAPRSRPPRRAAHGRLEALGWFIAAAVILAWPRRESPFDWSFLRRQLTPPVDPKGQIGAAEASEPGRGRSANSPAQIPAKGWRDIFWRAWTEFNRDNIPQVAGGVTFFGLLAVFPAMAALVSLYGLFFDLGTVREHIRLLSGVIPGAALDMVGDQLVRLATTRHSGLGFAFATSLLLSVWSANAGMKALMVGLNIAFEEKEKRNLVRLNLVSLAFTFGGLIFVLVAMGAVVAAPIALAFIGYKASAFALLRWPALLLVAVGALAVLYRYGPSREPEKWRWVSWGSALAAVLWLAASLLFSQYVAHFGTYDKTYGSLGAAIGFMTWIWISVITVLFGAEVNSEIEHQTAVDTTTGAPKPLGERGAKMADTIGVARPRSAARAKTKPRGQSQPALSDA